MPKATILVVDDEALIRWSLAERLKAEGYDVLEAETGRAALDKLPEGVDLILLDYRLPDTDGVTVLRKAKEFDQDILVILLTAYASVETAVEAMKLGAYHFANKPFNLDEVSATVERALETTRLRREVRQFRTNAARPYSLQRVVGASPPMTALRHLVARIAVSPASTVLLTGESGTGKDLVAKVIHYASDRSSKPFMNITCSALPEQLLESELFGHERGAFTDARTQKKGLLETADGGTVFLDEIGEMTPGLQAKLLRFLEEKSFKRVGGSSDIHVDVRVVAASNRDLEKEVEKHQFRADLFFRLNVLPISMPPLRAHAEDIPLLVEYFIDSFNTEFRKRVLGATPAAYALLQSYGWPGNVRELRNVIERAMLLSDGDRLDARDFSAMAKVVNAGNEFELPASGVDLEQLERSLLIQALHRCHGNQTRAGGLLGLNRDQIRYRIEKFGLTLQQEAH
ncbi:MAG TPA: sigma-54 dependent transcriptional regulator [Vicinamibacterales bacterium]|nr:sigma-54 dependent transcriptional regulator [Vicinamibacterales bacterium]